MRRIRDGLLKRFYEKEDENYITTSHLPSEVLNRYKQDILNEANSPSNTTKA